MTVLPQASSLHPSVASMQTNLPAPDHLWTILPQYRWLTENVLYVTTHFASARRAVSLHSIVSLRLACSCKDQHLLRMQPQYRATPDIRTTPSGPSTRGNKDCPSISAASTGGYLNWQYLIFGRARVKYSGIPCFFAGSFRQGPVSKQPHVGFGEKMTNVPTFTISDHKF